MVIFQREPEVLAGWLQDSDLKREGAGRYLRGGASCSWTYNEAGAVTQTNSRLGDNEVGMALFWPFN